MKQVLPWIGLLVVIVCIRVFHLEGLVIAGFIFLVFFTTKRNASNIPQSFPTGSNDIAKRKEVTNEKDRVSQTV